MSAVHAMASPAAWPALASAARPATPSGAHGADAGLAKLPHVTLLFWIMKIAATTLGETGGDLMSMTLHVGYVMSSIILVAILATLLACQLAVRRYIPILFWSVILLTSTAGTTMSDMLDRTFHLGYPRGAGVLLTLLGILFAIWRLTGESFAVDRIRTRRVELLYWTAILFSNTLGTALGDFLAHSSGLGFTGGAVLIGGLILLLAFLHATTNLSRTLLFWIAFVLTRPFGATLGDEFTKSHAQGGLGFGTVGSSAALLAVLLILVLHAHWRPAGTDRLA
jgi:uncharacterized membrane-anchored protein